MCRNCNSSFGANIDGEICKHLEIWSNLLNIKRYKGDPPTIDGTFEGTGTQIVWPAGRSPQVKFHVKSKQIKEGRLLEFEGGNWEKLQNYIGRLQQRYNNVEVGPLKRRNYSDLISLKRSIDLVTFSRAICKMAINFYILNGGDRKCIAHIIPYISEGKNANNVFFYYPESSKEDSDKKYDVILHTIFLRGDSAERELYAFIELFNAYKCLVILNDEYVGDDIDYTYTWDVLQRKKVNGGAPLNLSADQILGIKSEYIFPYKSFEVQLNRLLHTVVVKQQHDYISGSLDTWMDDALTLYEGVPVKYDLLGNVATGRGIGFVSHIIDTIRVVRVQKKPSWDSQATTQYVKALIDISIAIAKYRTLKRYPTGSPINHDLLLTFVQEFLTDMQQNLGGEEKEAVSEFINQAEQGYFIGEKAS